MKKLLFLILILPLSACFDADLTFDLHDDETATMSSKVSMGPELYGMIASRGEDPCKDGVGQQLGDGTYTCLIEETDTIDNLIVKLEDERQNHAEQNGVNPNQGVTVERLDGPFIKLSFDLVQLKQAAADTGMEPTMLAAFREAMLGHRIHMTIKGAEIVETNGTLSPDGKSAVFDIPLTALIETDASLPDSFQTIVRTQ
ncbi:hypothetical protein [Aliiroseovarius sp. 2305UL8-7]|uniref:hypothetical protein n=1 Tax=Aliiroseovarius conchicola TaxID=3121637 RepID=UPI00352943AA